MNSVEGHHDGGELEHTCPVRRGRGSWGHPAWTRDNFWWTEQPHQVPTGRHEGGGARSCTVSHEGG